MTAVVTLTLVADQRADSLTWTGEDRAPTESERTHYHTRGHYSRTVTMPTMTVTLLVQGDRLTDRYLDDIARRYADGSPPRMHVDLTQFSLSKKEARAWKAANKEAAKVERKGKRRDRYVYEGQMTLGEDGE